MFGDGSALEEDENREILRCRLIIQPTNSKGEYSEIRVYKHKQRLLRH